MKRMLLKFILLRVGVGLSTEVDIFWSSGWYRRLFRSSYSAFRGLDDAVVLYNECFAIHLLIQYTINFTPWYKPVVVER